MTKIVCVAGTWGYDGEPSPDEWNNPESDFGRFMRRHDVVPADPVPFVWDGAVDGVPFWPWEGPKAHKVWSAAGANLARYLADIPLADRNVIAHSHGGQVALYALMHLPVNHLITVSTPVREDMQVLARRAVKRTIRGWWHFYATGWSDRTQLLGSLFDGVFRVERRFLLPGVQNMGVPGGVGHSGLLNKPECFTWWVTSGALDWLRPARGADRTRGPLEASSRQQSA